MTVLVPLAHGIVGREDLPIEPLGLRLGRRCGARRSRSSRSRSSGRRRGSSCATERVVLRVPRIVEVLCGPIGIALFGVVVWAGPRRRAVADRQPRADVHLRPVLGRHPGAERCCSATSSGRSTRGARSAAAPGGSPSASRRAACPRRCRTPRGWAAGRRSSGSSASRGSSSSTRPPRRPEHAGDPGARLRRGAARRDEPLRRRGVDARRRRLRRLLPPVRRLSPLHWQRPAAVRAPAAVGR